TRRTDRPRLASSIAVAAPAHRAPTTTASKRDLVMVAASCMGPSLRCRSSDELHRVTDRVALQHHGPIISSDARLELRDGLVRTDVLDRDPARDHVAGAHGRLES